MKIQKNTICHLYDNYKSAKIVFFISHVATSVVKINTLMLVFTIKYKELKSKRVLNLITLVATARVDLASCLEEGELEALGDRRRE